MKDFESIPWIIAVLGWAAAHLFSEARERRKEMRAQLDKVHEQLYKLEQDGKVFHCADAYEQLKAGDLTSKLATMERFLNRIPILKKSKLDPRLVHLRQAITLKNFDKSSFVTQPQESEIVLEIASAAQDLEEELERQYRHRYPHTFPYIRFWSRG